MAVDQKLSALSQKASPGTSDLLYLLDVSDLSGGAAGTSKSITFTNISSTFLTASSVAVLTNKTFDTAGAGNVLKINGTQVSAKTGTGSVVLATTPTLVTPVLGVATATSINKVALTAPATSATLTIADGKSLIATDNVTLSTSSVGLVGGTYTFPSGNDTVVTLAATQTLTSKRITKRVASTTSSATPTPASDSTDVFDLTAQAATAAFQPPSGTPTDSQSLIIRIIDNATARALTWSTTGYTAGGTALPSTTTTGKYLHLGFMYVTDNSLNKWMLLASSQQ